jgi:YbgC/YbaW family acyl-CoA thioester hydrolase
VACKFTVTRRVEFPETDLGGAVHFSNFYRYMELAEHAFFRSLGLSIHDPAPEAVKWPRVRVSCDISGRLEFEDEIEIQLLVRERRARSIVYDFTLRKLNGEPSSEVARGSFAVACVRKDSATGAMRSVPIPESIARLIEPAPPELLAS